MKFLHTSDWHIGKSLKGRSRLDDQEAVLREVVGIARDNEVDAVLVAGDVYDSAAPSAEAQRLAVQTLLGFQRTGAEVIVIAGNHDHPRSFEAYRPLMGAAGITMVGTPRRADRGGVIAFNARGTGEPVRVAVLPFLSQRFAIRAAELVTQTPAQNAARYDQVVRDLLTALRSGFSDDAVNLVLAHLTVTGGQLGGGERLAQSIFDYYVPATAFPADAHYVALGHLHRRQTLPAPCPVVYCGSPLAVDFGEQDNTPVVRVVTASPGTPASGVDIPVTTGRRLRTVRGTVAELADRAAEYGDAYLRVWVREPARAGLREQVQEVLPNALEVRIDPEFAAAAAAAAGDRPSRPSTGQRGPGELLHEYLGSQNVADDRVERLFARLHDEIVGAERQC
ncbi:exonuclease SbcCD subunit D [Frankia sp. AgB1.9]|uniref:exonuclease SbcCD subunit D n=1 Tax=unclassified Frankia TaxID=2632575 RepID=UPI001931EE68|nr:MULTISPECIES: exonuclease SbcCD subunit D [unclassified Frankia]MBL7493753.1 exonuclease SbcCD subunit D [Frankia sp. AgW1.1]MBL7553048.1 exonuclease SbcCD subunit D [Frankia sp. AgB1.9]MBL7620526.1 exonuclease SbcCD subunit D [Frankia sp. AgB1.8]